MKVYLVTTGSYSDFDIEAVFSTKEKAEEFKRIYSSTLSTLAFSKKYSYYVDLNDEILEYDVDSPSEDWLFTRVDMLQDGEVTDVELAVDCLPGFYDFQNYKRTLVWVVKTQDFDRAVKVVNEKRIQILANNEWGDSKACWSRFTSRLPEQKIANSSSL